MLLTGLATVRTWLVKHPSIAGATSWFVETYLTVKVTEDGVIDRDLQNLILLTEGTSSDSRPTCTHLRPLALAMLLQDAIHYTKSPAETHQALPKHYIICTSNVLRTCSLYLCSDQPETHVPCAHFPSISWFTRDWLNWKRIHLLTSTSECVYQQRVLIPWSD